MKVKTCRYSNKGTSYNFLPALLVTPLVEVVQGWPLSSAATFPHPEDVIGAYPVKGLRVAIKFWTYHIGIEVTS